MTMIQTEKLEYAYAAEEGQLPSPALRGVDLTIE